MPRKSSKPRNPATKVAALYAQASPANKAKIRAWAETLMREINNPFRSVDIDYYAP